MMTPNEFKAWIDGFSQGVGDAPTAEQWAVVKAKANELAHPLGNLAFPQGAREFRGPYPIGGSSGDVPNGMKWTTS